MFLVISNEDDRSLVEDLYSKNKNRIFSIAYSVLKDKSLAEDAVHNTFVRIIDSLHKVKDCDEYKRTAFVCVICRNVSFDMYEINKKRFKKELTVDDIGERELKSDDNPADVCISNENIRILIDAIKNLKDIYRDVVMLKYVLEFNNEEISKLLDISQPTVRKRLERGKSLLMESLKGGKYSENR